MKNILLVCSSGMSTNMFVSRMVKSAKLMNFDANIWACGSESFEKEIDNADIILLGPQVRYLLEQIKKMVEKPVLLIDLKDYSSMNSEKILQECLAY